jgi:hypothetical protein
MKNLIGEKIGSLLVIKKIGKNSIRFKLECQCDCGTILQLAPSRLKYIKSCGCKHFQTRHDNPRWKGYGQVSGAMLYRIRRDASRRSIDFLVDAEYIYHLFELQGGRCALTGEQINLPSNCEDERLYKYTASLDRIDSSQGYVIGNLQWVHKDINYMKWDKNEIEFLEWCKKVVDFKLKSAPF